ncbi:uncharacterized protein LOC130182477 isoform X1 [Seriola aureovittata]|uniref:uncharacterized protein LOC130182477 isoform X1 n=1 Tax=Seriola aureovittata TaxID=2871759 RepID=UPI0024BD7275|nr:uncharacterized protein LOC130182477 isoform X1 [Seriola aureovittata]
MAVQRVAVIGAGAAGLCAARHILSRPNSFARPVVFELTDNIGGTWCYDERVGSYDNGRPVHSSMYRDLRTNLPKEVMMFPDFPFDPQLSSFLPHQEVQRYLERYCHSHNIRPHIRFNTAVENVKPVVEEETTTWEVTSCDSSGGQKTETFDSVFVCSGHYSDPHIPDIPGLENFKGEVLHSHSYRYAEPFSGQSVVVLGAKASGLDISIELAKVGAQVTLSHDRPRLTFPLPSGIRQSSPVVAVQDDGSVRFQDGSVGRADVLMFCTGYNFRYTFLDADQLRLEIQDHMVSPLYRFLTPPAFPSLFFIGICKIICPFPNFDCQEEENRQIQERDDTTKGKMKLKSQRQQQETSVSSGSYPQVQFALAVLDGSVSLPSRAEMEDEVRRELQEKVERGVQRRHLLIMEKDQWEYCRTLAHAAGFPPLPPVVRSLYEEVWRQRQIHPQSYRSLNYRLISDTQWELID